MQKSLAILVLGSALALASITSADETTKIPLFARVKVGQFVKLERALSGGYNMILLNDRLMDSFKRADATYAPAKVVDIDTDHLTIEQSGAKLFIAGHAIDVITELGDWREEKAAQKARPADAVFRTAKEKDRAAGGEAIFIGNYVLLPEAVEQLSKVYTLELKLNELKHFDGTMERWDKQNAELTVRQRMNDYMQTALDFYEGRGKRGSGEIGRRLQRFTDAECGDQELSSALMTVAMASMWDVSLEAGQAERLDHVLRKRLEMIAGAAARE